MEKRRFGRLGRDVGVIGLGAWQLGADWGEVSEEDAHATLAAAVYGASVWYCARLVGRLSQRWHASRLIGGGAAAAAAACGAVAVSPTVWGGVAAALLLGLAWTSMHSSLQTWATEVLPRARANVVSLFAGALFVGSALGAILVIPSPTRAVRWSILRPHGQGVVQAILVPGSTRSDASRLRCGYRRVPSRRWIPVPPGVVEARCSAWVVAGEVSCGR